MVTRFPTYTRERVVSSSEMKTSAWRRTSYGQDEKRTTKRDPGRRYISKQSVTTCYREKNILRDRDGRENSSSDWDGPRRGSETGRRDVMIRRVSEKGRNRKNSIESIQTRRSRRLYLKIDDSDRMEFRRATECVELTSETVRLRMMN